MLTEFPSREGEEPITREFLRAELAEFRAEMRGDLADFRTESADFRTEMEKRFAASQAASHRDFVTLVGVVTGAVAVATTLLAALGGVLAAWVH
jgi:hypothetical protein